MKKIFGCALILGLLSAGVMAGTVEDLMGQLGQGKELVCRKASFFDFKFSIRSGEGKLCTMPLVAAIADVVCGNYSDASGAFSESGCAKKAKTALAGRDSKVVLVEEVQKLGKSGKETICAAASTLPVLSDICKVL